MQPEDLPPRTMDLVSGGLAHCLCVAHAGSPPVVASTKVFGCRLLIRARAATSVQVLATMSSEHVRNWHLKLKTVRNLTCSSQHSNNLRPISDCFILFSHIFRSQNLLNLMSTCHSTNANGNEVQWNRRLHCPFLQRLFFPALRSARGADDSRPRAPSKPQVQCWSTAAG